MKVRVRDVAARAGVSPATVSNALNGRSGVSQEIAEQIRLIADEMGYSGGKALLKAAAPERNYVRLVMVKKHGLVVMDTQFFMELVESIERECRSEGYDLVITHIHLQFDQDYQQRISDICSEKCVGVIVLATEISAQDLELFKGCVSPLVALDNLFRHERVHAVVMNNYEAGYTAANRLYDAGHRQIEHITSVREFSNMRYRRKGYEAAMQEHGLSVSESCFWRVTPTFDGAYQDMKALLSQGRKPPTAFFAGNDIMAIGCVRALVEQGYRVPEDVSMIGMDDVQICEFCNPKLTTIRVFRQDMGIAAVRTLLSLAGKMTEGSILKTEISVALVERDSVAPPNLGEGSCS